MRLTAPKTTTFWVAVILVIVGLLAAFGVIPAFVSPFWLVVIGFVVLALGNLVKGL